MESIINTIRTITQDRLFDPTLSILTVVILAWTAIEALKANRATSLANELKLLPLLAIYFEERGRERKVYIKNWGEGAAFNIEILPWRLIVTDIRQVWQLNMKIAGETNLLGSREEKDIDYKAFANGKEVGLKDIMMIHLRPDTDTPLHPIILTLKFMNALGERYFTEILTGHGELKVITPPRRINFFYELLLLVKIVIRPELSLLWHRFTWLLKRRRKR